ncbi:putative Cucumisin precursor [Corchorus olitorius]|uniref:Cucumisin n=1 Tax=Corchorus olitorius TaxID=93759 RepID=A0A1R3KQ47_9ROSI|nr:putative Cucumisin precursor [Corchorus olitorius]
MGTQKRKHNWGNEVETTVKNRKRRQRTKRDMDNPWGNGKWEQSGFGKKCVVGVGWSDNGLFLSLEDANVASEVASGAIRRALWSPLEAASIEAP